MKKEKVEFYSEEQKIIGVLHIPDRSNNKAIVLVHGITVNKDEGGIFVRTAKKFCEMGYTVLRFDFRGHGESEGKSIDLSVKGELSDLNEAINFIKNRGFDTIGILAASFGGSIAPMFVAKNKYIKTLVLWNPILNYDNIFLKPISQWGIKYFSGKNFLAKIEKQGYITDRKGFKIGKKLFDEMKNIKPYEGLKDVSCPLLVIHGDKDTTVPYEDSKRYYKLARGISKFETVKGAEHGFHERGKRFSREKKVIQLSIDWFEKWLK